VRSDTCATVLWSHSACYRSVYLPLHKQHADYYDYKLILSLLHIHDGDFILKTHRLMALVLDACAARPQETLGTAEAAGTTTATTAAATTNPDAVACRRLLTRYLEQLCDQLDQFRDELLTAALQPLLRAPPALARGGDLRLFVKALQSALRAGASHLPTAAAAISALECWWAAVPAALEPYFPDLLPRLVS
jgi:hypothetical protein